MAWFLTSLDSEMRWEDSCWPDHTNSPIREIFCGSLKGDLFFVLNFCTRKPERCEFDLALSQYIPPLDRAPSFLMLSVSRHEPNARIAFGNVLEVPVSGGGVYTYTLAGIVDKNQVAYVIHSNAWFQLDNQVTRVPEGTVLQLRSEVIFFLYVDALRRPIHTRIDSLCWY